MTMITTTWTSAGITHSVETTQDPGETVEEWVARHRRTVDALQQIYPPDPA